VAANGTRSIGVLDCATDSFVKWIPHAGVACLAWDSVRNKMYVDIGVWGMNALSVIDCSTDAVVDTVANCPDGYYATAYSRRNRLYIGGEFGDIGIVNTLTDSVVFRVPVQVSLNECVVCNEYEDKVYAGARSNNSPAYDSVYVLDCLGDTVLRRRVGLDGSGYIDWVALAPWSNRLYCTTSQGRLFAVDCSTDSVVGVAEYPGAGGGSGYIVCHPDNHRIYAKRYFDTALYVFRDEPNGVTEPVSAKVPRVPQTWVWPNPASDWLMLEGTGEAELFCPDGRPVLALAPGRNDVRSLPAGVYFIRRAGRGEPCSMVKLKQ
jgi:hypothetical protein